MKKCNNLINFKIMDRMDLIHLVQIIVLITVNEILALLF